MPKANKVGKSRATANVARLEERASAPLEESPSDSTTTEAKEPKHSDELSKGQKKREARRKEFQKKLESINGSLKLTGKGTKGSQESLKEVNGLINSINEVEADVGAEQPRTTITKALVQTNKSKSIVALKEMEQFKLVLQHPEFQKNPFATIMEHLDNTLAPPESNVGGQRKAESKDGMKSVKKKVVEKEVVKRNGSRRGGVKRR